MRRRRVLGAATQPDAIVRLQQKFEYPDQATSQAAAILPPLSGGAGAFVHLARSATQSIGTPGEAISWDTLPIVLGSAEFSETVPTTTVTIPQAGYYNVGIQLGWSSFTGGGTLSVLRTRNGFDVTVWPPADDPGLWSTTDGQFFEGTAHAIECQANDLLAVILDADDASAQTLASATCAVYLVDRAGPPSAYADLVLGDGPLAYWRLDEEFGTNADDIAGHASGPFPATYVNTPTLGLAGIMQDGSGSPAVDLVAASSEHILGQDWSAFDFDGLKTYTVEVWFNADVIASGMLIGKQTAISDEGWEMSLNTSTLQFHRDNGTAGVVNSGTLFVDTDYHGVCTFDGTTMRLYVNGVEVDTDTGGIGNITANNIAVFIGRDIDTPGFNFDGTLDEIAVYDRELSAVEVAEHYAIGTRG